MHFLVYLSLSLLIITIQTTWLPLFPKLFGQFDLMIPFAVYLSLFRSSVGRLPVLLIAGSLMDLFTGGSMAVYLITYLLTLAIFRNAPHYFHLNDRVLYQIVIVLAVLIENLIFWLVIVFQTWSLKFSVHAMAIVSTQLVWVLLLGPLFHSGFEAIFKRVDHFITGGLKEKG